MESYYLCLLHICSSSLVDPPRACDGRNLSSARSARPIKSLIGRTSVVPVSAEARTVNKVIMVGWITPVNSVDGDLL
jgi:hypothetical protein